MNRRGFFRFLASAPAAAVVAPAATAELFDMSTIRAVGRPIGVSPALGMPYGGVRTGRMASNKLTMYQYLYGGTDPAWWDEADATGRLLWTQKYGKPNWLPPTKLPEPLNQAASRIFRKENQMAETFNADMANIEARIISYVEGDMKITQVMDEILIEKVEPEPEPEHIGGLA